MSTTSTRERRRERHVRRLSQRAMREAGPAADVGRALGKHRSTICHEGTTRTNREIEAALNVLIRLRQHPGVDGSALRIAMDEALDLEDLTAADDETLIARGLYLMDREHELEAKENRAAQTCDEGYWDALRAEGECQVELAQIGIEMKYRGVDLCALYRARAAEGGR